MKRRAAIKNGLAVSSSFFISSLLPSRPQTTASPLVAQVRGESPYAITQRAVVELGGMGKIVSRGSIVMVKPNIGWNMPPHLAATTNPDVVRAVVDMAWNAGAKKVIVMDHTLNKAEDAYRSSGIAEAARKSGAEVRYTDDSRLTDYDFHGEYIRKWPVYKDFLEIDTFINVPILKHHGSAGLTAAMKNIYGILGGNRGKLHRDIGYSIADMARGFKSHLVVIDAYRILKNNGPRGGRISDVETPKTVLASTGIVEADALAAELFGLRWMELEFLQAAKEMGMGEVDGSKIFRKSISL